MRARFVLLILAPLAWVYACGSDYTEDAGGVDGSAARGDSGNDGADQSAPADSPGSQSDTSMMGSCVGPPQNAMRSFSLTLTGVDFGEKTMTEWEAIGFNIDGKCTTSTSTDVCMPVAGAPNSNLTDGVGGIDNSYGRNICPMSGAAGNGACSSGITHIDIVTDDTGAGTMALPTQGFVIEYAVQHAYLIMNAGGGGVIGGVLPTESLVAATDKAVGCLASNLCSGPSLDSVNAQLRRASDTTVDGTSAQGHACDAISFGLTFTGSTAFNGMFPSVQDCCATDAGTD